MSFINANGLMLFLMLTCLILIKYNILKHVVLALFITGILQFTISGYADFIAFSIMLGFLGVTVMINKI